MDTNRDLIYLQLESRALQREREDGPAPDYMTEMLRLHGSLTDMIYETGIKSLQEGSEA